MKERILEILKNIRSDVDFENEKELIDEGIIESFDVIQIVTALMEEFSIDIEASDIESENFNSLEDICALVESKL